MSIGGLMVKFNWGSGATGALSGAGAGFSAGGPIGAGIGGLIGLLGGGFSGGSGKGGLMKDQTKQLPTMTPEQLNLLKQSIGNLQGGQLGKGYGESLDLLRDYMDPSGQAYQKFADPYMRQFEQETVPMLAERFAGLGGGMGGGLSSSGFGQSLGAAGANLQSSLAALKTGLAQQAAQQLMGQYGQQQGMALGQRPFGYQHIQGGPSVGQNAFASYAEQGFPGLQGFSQGAGQGFDKLIDYLFSSGMMGNIH